MTIYYLPTKVYHKRLLPKIHLFKHNIFYYMIDVELLDTLNQFSLTRFNKFHIWSIFSKDYGFNGDGLNFERFEVIKKYYNIPQGKIYLVTIPRFMGKAFNPVSFFLFYNQQNELTAVLCEVHNTFGERHCYMCKHSDTSVILPNDIMHAEKIFHVSPFFPVSGFYQFQFCNTENNLTIKIDYFNQKNVKVLETGIQAKKIILTKNKPFMLAIRYPFISVKILFLIHYHAVILWLKKIRFFKKPKPPSQQISS